ncbi:sugar porter family MFS transporter [Salinibacter ruber]|uniref:SP family sugar:H+ symporter-like MFS transporter n=1 Tax=Salinibacter ruber TaxID=146919 RepID=A0A9X2UAP0_9BACT|nr:sugar porter family MFS transporter [Salinibacter ruber]MCS3952840.1 SP family sugar:H+ symporter-like MFS transporter [Salinibacter ruber]MCS3956377.1 SP family sugar:H+ symporter-like MFS transporter [Salinibacter ruber]
MSDAGELDEDELTNASGGGNGNLTAILFFSFVAALGGFLFGFDSGVINGTVDALQTEFNSSEAGTGFNVASILLGSAVGAFFAGNLADRFGRRPVLILTALAFTVSALGSGASSGSAGFVFFRILGGLAVGAASILCPAYISEIAPPGIRGSLATLQQLMIVIGLFMAFVNNYLIAGAAGSASETFWLGYGAWRWMYWMETVPAALFFFTLLFIPETPRYLVAAGKENEARTVLGRLRTAVNIDDKIADIRSTLEKESRPSLSDIIQKHTGQIHPLVWAGLGLAILQQFTGINVVFYYGATLWQAAGFTEASALLTNVVNGSVNVFFTFVAIALIDRVGRKPLLQVGAFGQAVMLGIMTYAFGTAAVAESGSLEMGETMGLVALVAANGFIAFFAFSWGPVMWVMLGEMFPNKFRGAALSVCGVAQWLANFTITMTFPIMLENIGLGLSYGIYAFFGLVAFAFIALFIEETKGRTLEDMSREAEAGIATQQP